jgi:hypothetical protein
MTIIKHEVGNGELHMTEYRLESGDECFMVIADQGEFDLGISERTRHVQIIVGGFYLKTENFKVWYGNRSIGYLSEKNRFAIKPGQQFRIMVCMNCTVCFHVSAFSLPFELRPINVDERM